MSLSHRWARPILAACTLALAATVLPASAQAPTARIVVGNQPGGATDIVARLLAPHFSTATGLQFNVENRTGASGNIAAEHVAKAPADGNTILLIFNSHTTVSALFPKLPFDPLKDFASVGLISESPYLVVARPDIGVDNLKDLFARAKRTRTPITAGSPGQGTPQHLLFEKMGKVQDVAIETAHYKGSAPAQTDVMGGHVDITLVTPSLGAGAVKAGRLKLLAVTSDSRIADFPNVSTTREQGIDSLNGSGVWVALLVPAKTPRAVVAKLNKVLNDTIHLPEAEARLKVIGMTPVGGTPEALDKLMREEQATWTTLIRDAKITLE